MKAVAVSLRKEPFDRLAERLGRALSFDYFSDGKSAWNHMRDCDVAFIDGAVDGVVEDGNILSGAIKRKYPDVRLIGIYPRNYIRPSSHLYDAIAGGFTTDDLIGALVSVRLL